MIFRQLFDRETSTYTYLIADEATSEAALIDPVREQVERDLLILEELGLRLVLTLDTHVHADHVTGSGLLRERTGCKTALSADAGAGCPDILLADGARLKVGSIEIEARHTPGHTNGDITYVIEDHEPPLAFTGDTLLIRGCGRTDFQQGNAASLFESVRNEIFTLPDTTRVFPGHDYQGHTMSTVGEEKRFNRRISDSQSKEAFIETMANLRLALPKNIEAAVPLNLTCGRAG